MIYKSFFLLCACTVSTIAIAEPITWNNVTVPSFGNPYEAQDPYQQSNIQQTRYQQQMQQEKVQNNYSSSYGNQYQYDLNNPSDRLRYSIDVGAQLRDKQQLSLPSTQMERRQGQYGGGYIPE